MESIKELRKICQEPVIAENVWYMRNVARRVSIYITKLLLYTPVLANQITLLVIFMVIIAGVFLALGGYVNGLIGVSFLQLFLIFDCVDGEIGRYKRQSSLKGQYLDLIANDIVSIALFLGLSIGVFRGSYKAPAFFFSHDIAILACGLAAIISLLLRKLAGYYAKEVSDDSIVLTGLLFKSKKAILLKHCSQAVLHLAAIINVATIGAIFDLLPFVLIGYGIILPLAWIWSMISRLVIMK